MFDMGGGGGGGGGGAANFFKFGDMHIIMCAQSTIKIFEVEICAWAKKDCGWNVDKKIHFHS